ncbi:MAG: bifunctional diaminohydroxyphosphoribosylaminopyrimidine deaminase/5-amino-6-(5-phosphoribosylamino)uracil reductase RibD, partial [Clostridiaceae bacterium]|nr:bifunctional diaminohydroxyphosphoribosylaminopyrimidine deaminase/5-amino-6-(5-phosphoribosylamino)uracil reductase RibD [Clostridiaceae bacterium]
AGGGVRRLEEANIPVTLGVAQEKCEAQNIFFRHLIATKRPYVAQKYAMTLDGKIAASDGSSKWVTGEVSRAHVQELRRQYSGILVGIGTVLADDPLLTCRIDPAANPKRVICDNHLRIPHASQIVRTAKDVQTFVVCRPQARLAEQEKCRALTEAGIELIEINEDVSYWDTLLPILGKKGIDSLLIEGGGEIHGSCLKAHASNYIFAYLAPKLVGGKQAPSPIEGPGLTPINQAVQLANLELTKLGEDYLFAGVPKYSDNIDRNH